MKFTISLHIIQTIHYSPSITITKQMYTKIIQISIIIIMGCLIEIICIQFPNNDMRKLNMLNYTLINIYLINYFIIM